MITFATILLAVVVVVVIYNVSKQKPSSTTHPASRPKPVVRSQTTSSPSFPCTRHIEVKGTYYRSKSEISSARDLNVGERLVLIPDPENSVDPNAVKVYTIKGVHIGYVPASEAQFVKSNISHVSSCKVTKVSDHEVPFIEAVINFSALECKQPEFIPDVLQVSPADRLRDMTYGIDRDYKYRRVALSVDGVFEQSKEAIAKARGLQKGDKVVLKKADPSEFYPYRIDVFAEDGTFIGFAYNILAQEVYELFEKIHTVIVESPLDATSNGTIFLYVFFPDELKWREKPAGISVSISCGYSGPYPQLAAAETIKRTDTSKALEIALPIAECEKGINAKFLCCQCYRLQKDYESERKMILKILDRINTISPDEISRNEYMQMKQRTQEMMKRLDTVESRLRSKSNKKN